MPPLPPTQDLLLVFAICVGGLAVYAATWPLRHCTPGMRRAVLIPLCLAIAAIPCVLTSMHPQARSLMAILLGGILPCKMRDAHLTAETWRTQPFSEWLKFLIHPTVLVRRLHLLEPPRTRLDNVLTLARGVAQVLIGQAVFGWVLSTGLTRHSFLVEHVVLVLALYVVVFEGGNVMAAGFLRCLGSNVTDLSRWIYASTSPADFWRRYNRNAGQFFGEDVFKYVGGLRRPIRAVYATFMLNGILHEYFIAAATGRVYGYMLVFFALQATAVAVSFRMRQRTLSARVTGVIATLVVNIFTAIFFAAAVDKICPMYHHHRLLP